MGKQGFSPDFLAGPSAAGYLYQVRLALLFALSYVNRDSNVEVSIEALDDISFERDGEAFDLLQTKHKLNRTASLTDSGADLWKTIRIWAQASAVDPSLPGRMRFALVTTGQAADDSVAALLRPAPTYAVGSKRDPKTAADRLTSIAESSTNEALKPAFAAFLALSQPMRASLLSSVEILDQQPDLVDVEVEIEECLRLFAPRGQTQKAREMIEGWWWPRACKALIDKPPTPIGVGELEAKLDDVREMLKREKLNLDFEEAEPTDQQAAEFDAFRFIGQLRAIGVSGIRIQWAKRDYYRAFSQRSKWTREHAVHDGELASFEKRLIEEWEPRFERMCDSSRREENGDSQLQTAGQDLFHWVETEARIPFRSLLTRSLSVGSYHILANDIRLGWHRDYKTIFPKEGK
ncbi:ABC-three component system protein [Novosphingobium sp. BL-52-GroH]|uniref:ABC-three component system protein n=1 Tax=Novosphingobium sp. BL-52-GroH TaxID=3349877 RepID=UPI00384F9C04